MRLLETRLATVVISKNMRTSLHPLYPTWVMMIYRCNNPKSTLYKYYGARGITVCERWLNDFWAFVEDMGERPLGHSIDRLRTWLGYTPNNCRWAPPDVQSLNRGIFNADDPMRNVRSHTKGYQVSIRLKPHTTHTKWFKTLTDAQEYRDMVEYERTMFRELNNA